MAEKGWADGARRRRATQRPGWGFTLGTALLLPPVRALSRREWIGVERIPEAGGCIVVLNHVSYLDPVMTGDLLWSRGRLPRYLAKSALFTTPVVGAVLRSARQIPVERLTPHAVGAYAAAVEAVNAGELLAVYPEGTLTRDPDLWPMRGKSGAARIALATGAPVIPVGHWGSHDTLAPYSLVPRLWPRGKVTMKVGEPVDLSDLLGREPTPEVIDQTTDRIMAAVVAIVEELRQAEAPPERFDPQAAGVTEIGKPMKKKRTRRKKDGA
ncbi:lysophospholipid acyltransferase family protein [Nocardioides jishulii]|uniref:1-acyl-sn-glycerol-3-phosphate acyltransferase n=1 Tax=Nocardioides jishulii TaxID=2575440 RepID=A0A4U2YK07_9ACTN|nr:lysophospholipid acyltransferase family protein [Nocardioides jishulii]QCX27025.1 1-acyl-sn-glycerol-3-phosphate acyltransferase [Nocardioides jishulii]TKI61507.1 1-acyl-sn-glycerol-3-phosphate acyltransferase [Nocardioides jishulii]